MSGQALAHGRASSYRRGCRCDECRTAHADRIARQRAGRSPSDAWEHGRSTTYTNWGCRCDGCVAAARLAWRTA